MNISMDLFESYLIAGADPNEKENGRLLLDHAATKCPRAIPILLAHGAKVDPIVSRLPSALILLTYAFNYDFNQFPSGLPNGDPSREVVIDALIAKGALLPQNYRFWGLNVTSEMRELIEQRFALYQEKQKKPQAKK